jgi:hypothetical protein
MVRVHGFERLLSWVANDLGAESATLVGRPGDDEDDREITVPVAGGKSILVRFSSPPVDREAALTRLRALATIFDQTLRDADAIPAPLESAPRLIDPPVALLLHHALRAVADRALASDAIVTDAHSPVLWGSANVEQATTGLVRTPEIDAAIERTERTRRELVDAIRQSSDPAREGQDILPSGDPLHEAPNALPVDLTQRALRLLRNDASFEQLGRGKSLRTVIHDESVWVLSHSFASIYVLSLVFDDPFDELRAERALHDWLPRIERLVLALPPMEPPPTSEAGVVRFPRRMRRPQRG